MTDWFRSWHGAPTDPKWRTVAKRAGVAPALVVSVAWVLLDRASQADSRGSIDGTDIETVADFLGCETDEVERIIAALHDKAVLANDRFVAWERRQPKREREDETAAMRKAAERARKATKTGSGGGGTPDVTPSHTVSHQVTPRGEERRVEQKIPSPSGDGCSAEPADLEILNPLPLDPQARLFAAGKALLGRNAGGLIRKLLTAHGGNVMAAQERIDRAARAEDPVEFVAGCIRAATGPPARVSAHRQAITNIREELDRARAH